MTRATTRTAAALVALAACATVPAKNEAVGQLKRAKWSAQITSATFDGKLVRIAIGPRVAIVIASCYAHAQQKIGDHDHVQIELDGQSATAGELDITDCLTKHVVANLHAEFADGTKLDAALDTDLAKP